ncbi:uncharacterized protein LOC143188057 [Calliopsis andreniformis]|uniref:uncharacterized protein LOC143188057 n=1 Tax=Calliopsis andreniformis TaxID=337506 RepID=UPI003FCEA95C
MCTSSSEESCSQCLHMNVLRCWRRKWYGLITLIALLSIVLVIVWRSVYASDSYFVGQCDGSMDNELEEVYQNVLNRWYNFTDDVRWYNGKPLSPASPDWKRYLAELREDWIIWKHDPNRPYNLAAPKVRDQSMGQASKIRQVLNDKRDGFFVECGAYDGETRSNTLVFERYLNWTGLLVEADPINFSKMLGKNRRAYLTPTCLGIQPYPMLSSFLMANNIGRLHEPNASDSHLPNSADVAHSGLHISVQCFPFIHYMIALNVTTVNYFSLDVEGNELQILKTIPFDVINIETLSVEFSHVAAGRKELIDFMLSKGYYVYDFVVRSDKLAHDVIFVRNDYQVTSSIK